MDIVSSWLKPCWVAVKGRQLLAEVSFPWFPRERRPQRNDNTDKLLEVSYVRIKRHLFRTYEHVNSECDVCFVFVHSLEENDHLKAENRSLKKDLLAAIENSSTGEKKVALKSQ